MFEVDQATTARVSEFFDRIGQHLRRRSQKESFSTYAFGLLGEGDRKSVEPIAARASGDASTTERLHDSLCHFIRESPWSDRAVRLEAARYVLEELEKREPVTTWIVDDTGFLKQGSHSPGVQRQYTGSAGKITNCQIGVSLSIATRTEQVPIDFELYLPQQWLDDAARRRKARIPDDAQFMTKLELACEMIGRAVDAGIPGDVVLADSAYGRCHEFREVLRECGLDYAVGIDASARVWVLNKAERRHGDPVRVDALGAIVGPKAFRRITWRDGTKGKLASRFCFRRVKVAVEGPDDPAAREPVWLVIEWPYNEDAPSKYFLTTLRRRMSKKQIVRTTMERWKTERVYQELKGELGLDHYEGRSFIGWHHHVSAALCCYAFVVAERVRSFSPSAGGTSQVSAVAVAA